MRQNEVSSLSITGQFIRLATCTKLVALLKAYRVSFDRVDAGFSLSSDFS